MRKYFVLIILLFSNVAMAEEVEIKGAFGFELGQNIDFYSFCAGHGSEWWGYTYAELEKQWPDREKEWSGFEYTRQKDGVSDIYKYSSLDTGVYETIRTNEEKWERVPPSFKRNISGCIGSFEGDYLKDFHIYWGHSSLGGPYSLKCAQYDKANEARKLLRRRIRIEGKKIKCGRDHEAIKDNIETLLGEYLNVFLESFDSPTLELGIIFNKDDSSYRLARIKIKVASFNEETNGYLMKTVVFPALVKKYGAPTTTTGDSSRWTSGDGALLVFDESCPSPGLFCVVYESLSHQLPLFHEELITDTAVIQSLLDEAEDKVIGVDTSGL